MPDAALVNFQKVRSSWRLRLCLIALPFVPWFVLIPATSGLTRDFEVRQYVYLDTLPALVHAETPLYQSPLSVNDGRWPESPPSKTFTGNAYQLSGAKGTLVAATMPQVYGDAAIEVTVRRTNDIANPSSRFGADPGLILRATADLSDRIVFTVSQSSGDWTLEHLHTDPNGHIRTNTLADGFEDKAVRTEGPNTLLVLMRGDAFTLYVNGRYVDTGVVNRFEDDPLPVPPTGRVGVYLADGANTATFTNFAVYPVKSPPSLEYV